MRGYDETKELSDLLSYRLYRYKREATAYETAHAALQAQLVRLHSARQELRETAAEMAAEVTEVLRTTPTLDPSAAPMGESTRAIYIPPTPRDIPTEEEEEVLTEEEEDAQP